MGRTRVFRTLDQLLDQIASNLSNISHFCSSIDLQYRLHTSSHPGRVHIIWWTQCRRVWTRLSTISARLQQKLDASRFLMAADAVQSGRVKRFQWTRPATLVDTSSKNSGLVCTEGQAKFKHVHESYWTRPRKGKKHYNDMYTYECVEKMPNSDVLLFHHSDNKSSIRPHYHYMKYSRDEMDCIYQLFTQACVSICRYRGLCSSHEIIFR